MEIYDWHNISKNLTRLCEEYDDGEAGEPPCPLSVSRMNSILAGTHKPSLDELLILSEAFDVSINKLLKNDDLFPSLHGLKKRDQDRLLAEIAELKGEQ